MHYFSADQIYPIHIAPIKDGVLVVENDGTIVDLLDPLNDVFSRDLPIEKHKGILCPGFVNTHCHLELSHLRGKMTRNQKLPAFISEIVEKRIEKDEVIIEAMRTADSEMLNSGIVAVGDISNSALSVQIKKESKISYHTFIELFDVSDERTGEVFSSGEKLQNEFTSFGLRSSITPHAPYSVTENLLQLIAEHARQFGEIVSIHNQESASENEMFERGNGKLLEKLSTINSIYLHWKPKGKTSLSWLMEISKPDFPLQLVHNTHSTPEDIRISKKYKSIFWCLCINANLFIENSIPDIGLMFKEKCVCTIGTDSLASNDSLSILDELIMIKKHFHGLPLENLLTMATLNGARFLRMDDRFGTFEKGRIPGINLISNIDDSGNGLTAKSRIIRLI